MNLLIFFLLRAEILKRDLSPEGGAGRLHGWFKGTIRTGGFRQDIPVDILYGYDRRARHSIFWLMSRGLDFGAG